MGAAPAAAVEEGAPPVALAALDVAADMALLAAEAALEAAEAATLLADELESC